MNLNSLYIILILSFVNHSKGLFFLCKSGWDYQFGSCWRVYDLSTNCKDEGGSLAVLKYKSELLRVGEYLDNVYNSVLVAAEGSPVVNFNWGDDSELDLDSNLWCKEQLYNAMSDNLNASNVRSVVIVQEDNNYCLQYSIAPPNPNPQPNPVYTNKLICEKKKYWGKCDAGAVSYFGSLYCYYSSDQSCEANGGSLAKVRYSYDLDLFKREFPIEANYLRVGANGVVSSSWGWSNGKDVREDFWCEDPSSFSGISNGNRAFVQLSNGNACLKPESAGDSIAAQLCERPIFREAEDAEAELGESE